MDDPTSTLPVQEEGQAFASQEALATGVLEPPADIPAIYHNNWFTMQATSPVVSYLVENLWERPEVPREWEAARLSKAVYIYREKVTQWSVVVKFYAAKVGSGPSAERYANREFNSTQRGQVSGLEDGSIRVVRPLAAWRGVLLLEYVDGLTLEDFIAIRRNRPGMLLPALERTAALLARLHTRGTQLEAQPDFQPAVNDTREFADVLAKSGVLEGDPVVYEGVLRLIDRWAANPAMSDFLPVYIHGDATSSNFIFPWSGGVVAIDWERMHQADPANDLGRLMAEFSHSIQQYGGSVAEAAPLLQYLENCYRQAMPPNWDVQALIRRARFYQAASTLRIARNGWLSREGRIGLVAQAIALLS